jgi:hypothetical protein
MNVWRWILALLYALLFTYALVAIIQPGATLELGVIAGTVLSLTLAYAPGVAGVFNPLPDATKQTIFLVLTVLVALVVFGLSCGNQLDIGVACTVAGAFDLLLLLFSSIISGKGIHGANNFLAKKVRAAFAK